MFFKYDNPFISLLTRCIDTIIATFWFFVCCIPFFTIGASITAVTATMMSIHDDSCTSVTKKFFKTFRNEFRLATYAWLIVISMGILLALDYKYCWEHGFDESTFSAIIFGVTLLFSVVFICILVYVFAGISKFIVTLKQALFNSLAFARGNIIATILLFILLVIMILLFYFFNFLVFPAYSLCIYLQACILCKVFKPYTATLTKHTEDA